MMALGRYADDDVASTIKARDFKDATDLVLSRSPISFDCKGTQVTWSADGATAPLRSMAHLDGHQNAGGHAAVALPAGNGEPWAVRRLTPRECERLMGLPDDYTLVPVGRVGRSGQARARADSSGAFCERDGVMWRLAADGPRYAAIGNSWAVNCAQWLGAGIRAVEDRHELWQALCRAMPDRA